MPSANKQTPSREKVRAHREWLRAQGLRPIQILVPDTRSPAFAAEARRQSRLVGESPRGRGPGVLRCRYRVEVRMKHGEIWTVSGGPDYAGKPRSAVIVQDDAFPETNSVTLRPFTSDPTDAPLTRLAIAPNEANGLKELARIMVDEITMVPKAKFGDRTGRFAEQDVVRLNRTLVVFLGLAG